MPTQEESVATPVPSSVPSGFFKRHWLFYASIGVFVCAGVIGIGFYYYYVHRAYTESQILALIQQDIIPSVVQIGCADEDGGPETQIGSGIYYVDKDTSEPYVETNAHVVLGSDGAYHGCNVYFPRASDGAFYDSAYATGQPTLYHNLEANIDGTPVEGLDYALLPLAGPDNDSHGNPYPFPPKQGDIYVAMAKMCKNTNAVDTIGDKIYIIGYPGTGGSSVTLTEGVVSGFAGDFDQWIKVSASTNHGNSGGLAIGALDGCTYGIPTEATFETGANLGYVLSSGFIRDFAAHLTGASTYEAPATTTDPSTYLTHTYTFPDFTVGYPDQWSFSTTSPDSTGEWSVSFVAPDDTALDDFDEQVTVYAKPNSSQSDFTAAVSDVQALGESLDPELAAKAHYVTLGKQVRTYQILFTDSTDQNFSVPVLGYEILFLQGGTLYTFVSVGEQGPNLQKYLRIFAGIGDSLKFKNEK